MTPKNGDTQQRVAYDMRHDESEINRLTKEKLDDEVEPETPPEREWQYFPTDRDREIWEEVELARRPVTDVAARFGLAPRTVRNIAWLAGKALARSRHLLDRHSTTEDLRLYVDSLRVHQRLALESYHASGGERTKRRIVEDQGKRRMSVEQHHQECNTRHLRESRLTLAQLNGALGLLRVREKAEKDAQLQQTAELRSRELWIIQEAMRRDEEEVEARLLDCAAEESCAAEAKRLEEQALVMRETAASIRATRELRNAEERFSPEIPASERESVMKRLQAVREEMHREKLAARPSAKQAEPQPQAEHSPAQPSPAQPSPAQPSPQGCEARVPATVDRDPVASPEPAVPTPAAEAVAPAPQDDARAEPAADSHRVDEPRRAAGGAKPEATPPARPRPLMSRTREEDRDTGVREKKLALPMMRRTTDPPEPSIW